MRKIKTFLAVCLLSLFTAISVQGQDMATATELYNSGAKALSESNYVVAIESFNKALKMLEALPEEDRGEDGNALVAEAKSVLPQIYLRYGKELASSGNIDSSMEQLKLAADVAKKFNVEGVSEEVESLMPQLLMADASALLNEGKLAEAIAGFNKLVALDSANKDAYLRIGLAQSRLNDENAALAAFEKAAKYGETANAPKQISVIYLKRSAAAVKGRDWKAVYENAKKANEYSVTSNGHKLIGLSSVQLKKYDEAIEAIDSYLSMEPNARDKNSMMYNLAVSYEAKGNSAKACGYYKQLLNDPTYKQMAEYKVKTQLKCS
ncbi:MAG: tetratricopeptide repeat protein [Bacteroidales bacterium]|jgi:tetratricopeptide (TPR) repeat protein|nr:tetratricopeptide repeat protein [Bacteroidales bacterium]MDD3299827.1 tetratricopeptide repeat protein [Bacteroidales bacterium]MDD3843051.1 tetratricopeptide repeat protein [Bacteroidales bacterium]MDD4618320.1 tetratricopeptide repeat protein [Bacteroidales bacterium]